MPKPDPRESRLLLALKRQFPNAQSALKALGLDAKLLARDQDEDQDAAADLRELLASLTPEQKRALLQMLSDEMSSEDEWPDDDELIEDEPPPFANGGRPRPGGEVDPVTGYRPNVAQDRASFNRLFPSAHLIGHQALGSVDPAQRAIINAHRPRRIAIAKDRAPPKAPSFNAMFPDAKRIGHLG